MRAKDYEAKKTRDASLFLASDLLTCILEVELDVAEMACVPRNIRRTLHVPSGVPVQRSISERDVSYPSCFVNPPPQRLSSLFSRGHRRFVEGCLLKHQQVM